MSDIGGEWVKIDVRLLSDWRIVDLTSEYGAAGIGYWIYVITEAKLSSKFGTFTTSERAIKRSIGCEIGITVLRSMENLGMIELEEDVNHGTFTVTVIGFDKWQVPRAMTGAERMRKLRGKAHHESIRDESVTIRDESVTNVTQTRQDKTRQEEKEKEKQEKENPETTGAEAPLLDKRGGVPRLSKKIAEVVSFWIEATYVGSGPKSISTPARRRKVADRLKEGFSEDDLKLAIKGFAGEPWYQGHNNRGTRYLGIETILRDAGQVEKGMAFASAGQSPPRPQLTIVANEGRYRKGAAE